MTIVNFTPLAALYGGILLGLAATVLLLFNGRIFGVTGIISGILTPVKGDFWWRALMVLGLGAGAFFAHHIVGTADYVKTRETIYLVVGGFMTGLGARFGSGCTSGHGICGIARLSPRSIVATCTFMGTGMITVIVLRLFGVSL